MISKLFRCSTWFLLAAIAGCSSIPRQDISKDSNVKVVQPLASYHVELTANVYMNPTRTALWISGNARNTTGNPLIAGHVHATLFGPERSVLADDQFLLLQNGGTSRLQRGSKKKFGGEILAEFPADFTVEIAYHTLSH